MAFPGGYTLFREQILSRLQDTGAVPVEALLPGCEQDTPQGRYYLGQRRFSLSYQHGRHCLGSLLGYPERMQAYAERDTALRGLDLQQALYLDTETTGLRSRGTYVFLVGIGYFQNGFHLDQYLMRSPSEELALLQAVSGRLTNCTGLVTFNGRSFDWPLVMHRLARAGLPQPPAPPHLDLLHVARRHWRGHLPSCSLASLEYHVLQVERGEDVPSRYIPALYREYLVSRDGRLLHGVLEHNALDILSLVTLANHLGEILVDQTGP